MIEQCFASLLNKTVSFLKIPRVPRIVYQLVRGVRVLHQCALAVSCFTLHGKDMLVKVETFATLPSPSALT